MSDSEVPPQRFKTSYKTHHAAGGGQPATHPASDVSEITALLRGLVRTIVERLENLETFVAGARAGENASVANLAASCKKLQSNIANNESTMSAIESLCLICKDIERSMNLAAKTIASSAAAFEKSLPPPARAAVSPPLDAIESPPPAAVNISKPVSSAAEDIAIRSDAGRVEDEPEAPPSNPSEGGGNIRGCATECWNMPHFEKPILPEDLVGVKKRDEIKHVWVLLPSEKQPLRLKLSTLNKTFVEKIYDQGGVVYPYLRTENNPERELRDSLTARNAV